MRGVAFEHLFFHPLERSFNCLDLVEDVEAITGVFDHVRNTAHLTFNAIQVRQHFGVVFICGFHTPMGYMPARQQLQAQD